MEVWNQGVMEARGVAMVAARSGGGGGGSGGESAAEPLGGGNAHAVSDALELWAESAGLEEKVRPDTACLFAKSVPPRLPNPPSPPP